MFQAIALHFQNHHLEKGQFLLNALAFLKQDDMLDALIVGINGSVEGQFLLSLLQIFFQHQQNFCQDSCQGDIIQLFCFLLGLGNKRQHQNPCQKAQQGH